MVGFAVVMYKLVELRTVNCISRCGRSRLFIFVKEAGVEPGPSLIYN